VLFYTSGLTSTGRTHATERSLQSTLPSDEHDLLAEALVCDAGAVFHGECFAIDVECMKLELEGFLGLLAARGMSEIHLRVTRVVDIPKT
jgi:hypothetical protein